VNAALLNALAARRICFGADRKFDPAGICARGRRSAMTLTDAPRALRREPGSAWAALP